MEFPVPAEAPVIPAGAFTVQLKVAPGTLELSEILIATPVQTVSFDGIAVAVMTGSTVIR